MVKNIQAFPINSGEYLIENGMTLRDYFAAKTMQACLSNSPLLKDILLENQGSALEAISDYSYQMADAMLKQREL